MDTKTGEIKFFKDEKELKAAKEANPNLVEVELNHPCNKCDAFGTDGEGNRMCKGGNRKMRREVYKCRVKKIIR